MAMSTIPREEASRGFPTTTATSINGQDCSTTELQGKTFSTLRATYAMKGHTLHRTDPADGPVTYWTERWGQVRHFSTIDATLSFLEQIGGRL